MANGFYREAVSRKAAAFATCLISLVVVGLLAGLVASRRGNLAWDDADYLRRALANARVTWSGGRAMALPRAVDSLLHEQPKPPWLVAWIQMGTLAFDRHRFDILIIYASIVPYALLLLGVVYLGRQLAGPWGGLMALVCVISSPYSLAFGGKVMVETFLSLWVLLIFALTCRLLEQPSRRRGLAVGTAVGFALLTKLTTILFVPIPLMFALVHVVRGGPDRRTLVKSLLWSAVICAAIAGPWYAFNTGKAVRFAQFSSKFNVLAEGRPDSLPSTHRLFMMTNDLAGWPMAVTLTCAAVYGLVLTKGRAKRGEPEPDSTKPTALQTRFSQMAWLGAGTAATILLFPTYFDTRFLLPIVPVLAVDLGRRLAATFRKFPAIQRTLLGTGLAAGVLSAAFTVARAPTITTYWNTTALIDDLVQEYGIRTLGNVGNCAEWNVQKTGLFNELRDQPANCFVLHDLTRLSADDAPGHLERFDAVVVLGRRHLPADELKQASGLNRSYNTIAEALANDPTFTCVPARSSQGLPELSVYIHRRSLIRTERLSRKPSGKRR